MGSGSDVPVVHPAGLFGDDAGEFLTFHIFHDDRGGLVGGEDLYHGDDIGVLEFGQHLGFIHEAVKAPIKVIFIGCGPRGHFGRGIAYGQAVGQIFLNGHQLVERCIPRFIGDAKTPGPQNA